MHTDKLCRLQSSVCYHVVGYCLLSVITQVVIFIVLAFLLHALYTVVDCSTLVLCT